MNHHKHGQPGPADGAHEGAQRDPAGESGDPSGAPAGPGHTHARRSSRDVSDPRQGAMDIQHVLHNWDYEPGTINVRKVNGSDGAPKLQMRLDLGLLQMEMTGRPDGRRPHGCESLLDFHEGKLAEHTRRYGTDLGFQISPDECQSLREEGVMYYQRYLSLFVLEEFAGVVRDTARNIRLLDLCGKFAIEEEDRLVLEQYRPYILMMNARAKASIHLTAKRFAEALREIDLGLGQIRSFFNRFGQPEAYGHANEVKVLKRLAREVRKKLPVDPLERLTKKLNKAIKAERYESAARLRDKIAAMKGEPGGPRQATPRV